MENIDSPPSFERRSHRYARASFVLTLCCGLSLAALIFWLIPVFELQREASPALTLVVMDLLSLVVAVTAVAAIFAHWWRRRFERRGRPKTVEQESVF